jgi:carboxyl-terminal processing protease
MYVGTSGFGLGRGEFQSMKPARGVLLVLSVLLVAFVVGGGFFGGAKVEQDRYRQVILFSEVLSDVLDSYVDPLNSSDLVHAAYEGMLGGLDSHGAYLTPAEVVAWKNFKTNDLGDPGFTILKAGRAMHIVSVDPASPAATAGIEIGDQVRSINGTPVRDMSLDQAWRAILGKPGTTVRLGLLHPQRGFHREELELERIRRTVRAYDLDVVRDTAILHVRDLSRLTEETLAQDLGGLRGKGAERLLLDLRNVADTRPRDAAGTANLFLSGVLLRLKDHGGRVLEQVDATRSRPAWAGPVAVLLNGSTAGGAEALARLLQAERAGTVLGEPSYGLGSEPKLYELKGGAGVILSAAVWETASGARWNGEGIQPDQVIHGRGANLAAVSADQLNQALQWLEQHPAKEAPAQQAG